MSWKGNMTLKFVILIVSIVFLGLFLEVRTQREFTWNCSDQFNLELDYQVTKQLVKQQNKIRSTVAKGKAVNGTNGNRLPKAGNMYRIAYSTKLEKKAIKIANKCNFTQPKGTSVFVAPMDASDPGSLI